jgi:hypothetical protein
MLPNRPASPRAKAGEEGKPSRFQSCALELIDTPGLVGVHDEFGQRRSFPSRLDGSYRIRITYFDFQPAVLELTLCFS